MNELLEQLRLSPTPELYVEARFRMIELANQIAELEVLVQSIKEELKYKDADLHLEIKQENPKKTIKEIDALVAQRLKKNQDELNKYKAELIKKKASYDAIDKFLKSIDTYLYYDSKNDVS